MIAERNEMVAHPLGFVHGVLGRIRELIGPEVTLRLDLRADLLTCTIGTPNGVQPFTFSDADYEQDADMLASSIRSICEQRGLITKEKS